MTDKVDAARRHQAAYDVLPPDADDDLYALADRIADAVEAAIRTESEATVAALDVARVTEAIRAALIEAGLGSGASLGVPERIGPLVYAALADTPEAESEATVAALREDWIDHLPGITHVGNVTFGELMVPVSAIREHFRAALAATPAAKR